MRALKAVVVGLGVLCLGAFGVLVWLVASGNGAKREAVSGMPAATTVVPAKGWGTLDLGLPAGSRIVAIAPAGTALSIHLRLPDGAERIVVVDPGTGTELGRIVPGEK